MIQQKETTSAARPQPSIAVSNRTAKGISHVAVPVLLKKVNTPGSHNPVQLYYENKGWKISENNKYRVNMSSNKELHVKTGLPGPNPGDKFIHTKTTGGFDVYKFNASFQNDCLAFAEYLAKGKYDDKPAFRSKDDRPGKTDRLFGQSDDQNMDIAKAAPPSDFSKKHEANPGLGEAFVAIRQKLVKNKCPFHVAYTVATDADDRITCEGDAGSVMAAPAFDMYMVKTKKNKAPKNKLAWAEKKSFFGTYFHPYRSGPNGKLPPTVGVLAPRVS